MSELETEKRIYKKMHKMKPKSKFTYLDGGRERSKPSKSIRDLIHQFLHHKVPIKLEVPRNIMTLK